MLLVTNDSCSDTPIHAQLPLLSICILQYLTVSSRLQTTSLSQHTDSGPRFRLLRQGLKAFALLAGCRPINWWRGYTCVRTHGGKVDQWRVIECSHGAQHSDVRKRGNHIHIVNIGDPSTSCEKSRIEEGATLLGWEPTTHPQPQKKPTHD